MNTEQTKVAMITGAGSGIGRAVSLALLNKGYSLVLTGRRLKPLEETAALSGENANNCLTRLAAWLALERIF